LATWEDVERITASLPGLEQTPGKREWQVRGRPVAWHRVLQPHDLDALEGPPAGDALAVRVPDMAEQKALTEGSVEGAFNIPHFTRRPIVLVDLERVGRDTLAELITDGWATQAPKSVVARWMGENQTR
jgi:hypothetical protein